MRPIVAAAVAAALAAAACRSGKNRADSAAAGDSAAAAAAVRADSVALPAPGAPGTAPSPAGSTAVPNGTAKPAAPATTKGAGPQPPAAAHTTAGTAEQDASRRKELPLPDTSPRPSNRAPAGATTPALVVFRDSVMTSDVDWLRSQGFTIVDVRADAHAVAVRVPQSYSGNPKANPRVLRFSMAMR